MDGRFIIIINNRLLLIVGILSLFAFSFAHWTNDLRLPSRLLEYKIRNDPELKKRCLEDSECPFTEEILQNARCWGFESTCSRNLSYSAEVGLPKCKKNHHKPQADQIFYDQADFGYLKERQLLSDICISKVEDKSSLSCNSNLRYCTGRNIFFDFKSFKLKGSIRGHELENFRSYDTFKLDKGHCDVIFERPTFIIKLDASGNLYHHMCDFVNLFASQFINDTTFDRDIDILWWDTHETGFNDHYFGSFWKVFSTRKPIELISLAGKKVCFKNFVLPLLARQFYGLFYNMPLIKDCHGSALMQAFADHALFRLRIPQYGPLLDKIRITILSRSTQYRRILNLDELQHEISSLPNVELKIVDYNKDFPFLKQLEQTHNSDIFMGMHGSGLTHLLFLPPWAAVFEIYNCEDEGCYLDLSRLKGIKYYTWPVDKEHLMYSDGDSVHPQNGRPHKKFDNYRFDPKTFVKIVKDMIEYVKRHPLYVQELRKKRRELRNKNQEL